MAATPSVNDYELGLVHFSQLPILFVDKRTPIGTNDHHCLPNPCPPAWPLQNELLFTAIKTQRSATALNVDQGC